MAVFYQPIYTQTVGAGGASSITFNNIPQVYTDLKLEISSRCDGAVVDILGGVRFNSDSTNNYSDTELYISSTTPNTIRHSNNSFAYMITSTGSSATANTFGTATIYIPNYTSTNAKQFINDSTAETNSATALTTSETLLAGLYRGTSAISSMQLFPGGGYNFVQYSTFSLYGILRQGI